MTLPVSAASLILPHCLNDTLNAYKSELESGKLLFKAWCGAPSQITLFPGNVVWLDDITSTRALINLSRMLDKKEVTDTDSSKPAELSDQPQKGLSSNYTSPDISLCNLEIDALFHQILWNKTVTLLLISSAKPWLWWRWWWWWGGRGRRGRWWWWRGGGESR